LTPNALSGMCHPSRSPRSGGTSRVFDGRGCGARRRVNHKRVARSERRASCRALYPANEPARNRAEGGISGPEKTWTPAPPLPARAQVRQGPKGGRFFGGNWARRAGRMAAGSLKRRRNVRRWLSASTCVWCHWRFASGMRRLTLLLPAMLSFDDANDSPGKQPAGRREGRHLGCGGWVPASHWRDA
jgi:hypothetical protein